MTRTLQCLLTLCLFLVLGFYSNYSQAGTIVLQNNTDLTLEVDIQKQHGYSSFVGYIMPQSSIDIPGLTVGYWDVKLKSVTKDPSGDDYYRAMKSGIINNETQIVKVAVSVTDFGRKHINGPGCDPSMDGKYANLKRRIQVADDLKQYGKCKDYGKWSGTKYKGYDNLPNGYWVYMYPDWYIWGGLSTTNTQPNETKATSGCDTTMGGKYSNPIKTVSVPEDKGQYGECHDWGHWKGKVYKGHKNLPAGYWVYKYPNWIIYSNKN